MSNIGHNSGFSKQAVKALQEYVAKLEKLEQDIIDKNADKASIYKDAKSTGFDTRALKTVIRRRRAARKDVEQQDAMLELYEMAINGSPEK